MLTIDIENQFLIIPKTKFRPGSFVNVNLTLPKKKKKDSKPFK